MVVSLLTKSQKYFSSHGTKLGKATDKIIRQSFMMFSLIRGPESFKVVKLSAGEDSGSRLVLCVVYLVTI